MLLFTTPRPYDHVKLVFLRDQFFMRSVKGGLVSIAAADAPLIAGLPALTFCPRFLRDAVGRGIKSKARKRSLILTTQRA